jgi:hypothetical protein
MSSQTAMSIMSVAEFGLWSALALLFWSRDMHRRFPAMGAYLALRLVSMPVLLVLFQGQAKHWFNDYAYMYYFSAYWVVYIASAVFLFFVCQEVFRSALSGFSGLQRLGTVVFRWVALVSAFASLSTVSFKHLSVLIVPDVAYRLMRSVSILELCLLAFLCLSMNELRLSARSMTFGIALGFGLMSSSDFILSSFWSLKTGLTDPLQFISESVILLALSTWITYAFLPERATQPVLLPVNSMLFRWNEIASALGHTGTQVAVQQQASGFFLTDVEKVVEDVLTRNLKGRESET